MFKKYRILHVKQKKICIILLLHSRAKKSYLGLIFLIGMSEGGASSNMVSIIYFPWLR